MGLTINSVQSSDPIRLKPTRKGEPGMDNQPKLPMWTDLISTMLYLRGKHLTTCVKQMKLFTAIASTWPLLIKNQTPVKANYLTNDLFEYCVVDNVGRESTKSTMIMFRDLQKSCSCYANKSSQSLSAAECSSFRELTHSSWLRDNNWSR